MDGAAGSDTRAARPRLPPQHTADDQQQDPRTGEAKQRRAEPQRPGPPGGGRGAGRAEELGLLRQRAPQLLAEGVSVLDDLSAQVLPEGVGVVPDVPAQVCMPGVELLRQGLLLGVDIVPRRLLGPEGQDAQQRGRQGGLLVVGKPGGAELLEGQRRLSGVWPCRPAGLLEGDLGLTIVRLLNGVCHRCLTQKKG
jgi:hypothetical protein